jgi:hypothetical protein
MKFTEYFSRLFASKRIAFDRTPPPKQNPDSEPNNLKLEKAFQYCVDQWGNIPATDFVEGSDDETPEQAFSWIVERSAAEFNISVEDVWMVLLSSKEWNEVMRPEILGAMKYLADPPPNKPFNPNDWRDTPDN